MPYNDLPPGAQLYSDLPPGATLAHDSDPASRPGFFDRLAPASGLSILKQVITHPLDSANTVLDAGAMSLGLQKDDGKNPILNALGGMVDNTTQNFKQGMKDLKSEGFSEKTRRDFGRAVPIAGPALASSQADYDQGSGAGAAGTLAGTLLGVAFPEVLGEGVKAAPALIGKGIDAVRPIPGIIPDWLVGNHLDVPLYPEGITPREQYKIAQEQDVKLDAAQATNSPKLFKAKTVTDASMGGGPVYAARNTDNVKALQIYGEKLLDQTAPAMSREDFGNLAKTKLAADQEAQNEAAGQIYDELSDRIGTTQPPMADIRTQAKRIIAENASYYDKHPDMLRGGAGSAWRIVNNLAAEQQAPKASPVSFLDAPGSQFAAAPKAPVAAPTPDTWSDLHKLRSDLLDITRGPEFVGDRPTGWIKQLTGAVDQAMETGAAKLSPADAELWRQANEIYGKMKQTYDDPRSILYHVVRAPDGLTAANRLASQSVTPEVMRQIGAAAPELLPQLHRQTMSRLLSPAGNDAFDLKNLPSRFTRAQKEQLEGILTHKQRVDLENLARTSRIVNFDDNPAGTAKKLIPTMESGAIAGGIFKAASGALSGDPGQVLEGISPIAVPVAARITAKAMTSPKLVDRLMTPKVRPDPVQIPPSITQATQGIAQAAEKISTPMRTAAIVGQTKGMDRWAQLGVGKLKDHIGRGGTKSDVTPDQIDALASTPQGKRLLIEASDLAPGSAAMANLVKQIAAKR